jgi:haloalkane dehalogenase
MTIKRTSTKPKLNSKFIDVFGSKMHYLEAGEGDPVLFLHGVPTSSYIWRNIIPHTQSLKRCIAVDLIGFGKSDKPDLKYSIDDHITYLNGFISALNLKNITLVMHGWGSVIGFDYAMRNETNCQGLIFYEAFLRTINESNYSLPFHEQYAEWSDSSTSEALVTEGASFVDKVMPQQIMKRLSSDDLNEYRLPFTGAGSGKPIRQYINELTTNTENIDRIIKTYTEKLIKSKLPKLMLYSVPGFITTIATVMWAKENFSNLEVVDIGEEFHLAQESNPDLIGETISVWIQGVEQR